jgi:hypothetical protein
MRATAKPTLVGRTGTYQVPHLAISPPARPHRFLSSRSLSKALQVRTNTLPIYSPAIYRHVLPYTAQRSILCDLPVLYQFGRKSISGYADT